MKVTGKNRRNTTRVVLSAEVMARDIFLAKSVFTRDKVLVFMYLPRVDN